MEPNLPSRLQQLPRELRENVYFYLCIPVSGYCIHTCDTPCEAFNDWYRPRLRSLMGVDGLRSRSCSSDTNKVESKTTKGKERIIAVKCACPHHGRGDRPIRVEGIDEESGAKVSVLFLSLDLFHIVNVDA